VSEAPSRAPLSAEAFVEWLRREGETRYHDHHRYHVLMHDGKLTQLQLQQWVLNRYYYQTRVPIKDAIILSKSEDPAFRRMWIRRIHDHDGDGEGAGGLELWLRLAEGVGLDRGEVASCRSVLPGVKFACDGYVDLVRETRALPSIDNLPKKKQEVFRLVVDSIQALRRENYDVIWGSMVKQSMQRKQPYFNESYYGYKSFSELLEDAERHAIISMKKDVKSGGYVVSA